MDAADMLPVSDSRFAAAAAPVSESRLTPTAPRCLFGEGSASCEVQHFSAPQLHLKHMVNSTRRLCLELVLRHLLSCATLSGCQFGRV